MTVSDILTDILFLIFVFLFLWGSNVVATTMYLSYAIWKGKIVRVFFDDGTFQWFHSDEDSPSIKVLIISMVLVCPFVIYIGKLKTETISAFEFFAKGSLGLIVLLAIFALSLSVAFITRFTIESNKYQ